METCHALAGRGHDVRLIVRPDTRSPARDPFEYYGLAPTNRLVIERAPVAGPGFARRLGYLSFSLGRAIGGSRADLLLTRDLGAADLLLRIPAAVRGKLVFESHGYAPDVAAAMPELVSGAPVPSQRKLNRLDARERAVWRGADGYVTITNGLAGTLADRFGPRERLVVVPDGVRLSPQRHTPPRPAGPALVAYAGHLYPWKGVDVLLDAVARIPEVTALIVGGHEAERDRARLETRAAQLGVAERVTFTGHVAPARVPELLQRASFLALPNPASAISTRFTSPLKLFEYMAADRPIVASDLAALREVLVHEKNAILVQPGDPEALAAGIRRLMADPALAHRLARQALEDVAAYSWERRAERLETFFAEVLAAR
jgi:glycosyltransferase involved in cell wall biosynthesis